MALKVTRGVYRSSELKKQLVNEVDQLRDAGVKVREAVKRIGIKYRTYYQYKKEICNNTLHDKRVKEGITDKHIEYIGAIVCAWPHVSLDSYLSRLKFICPDLNRTKLYNFLLENGMSTRKDRLSKVEAFMKRSHGTIRNYTSHFIFRDTDASLKVDYKDESIQRKLRKERKSFWTRHLLNPGNEMKDENDKLDYRNLFRKGIKQFT